MSKVYEQENEALTNKWAVLTEKECGHREPKAGYEWDAGCTLPMDPSPGRWTVRRDTNHWVVLFHSFTIVHTEYIIQSFSPTEDGERAAKTMALKLVDIARSKSEYRRF